MMEFRKMQKITKIRYEKILKFHTYFTGFGSEFRFAASTHRVAYFGGTCAHAFAHCIPDFADKGAVPHTAMCCGAYIQVFPHCIEELVANTLIGQPAKTPMGKLGDIY